MKHLAFIALVVPVLLACSGCALIAPFQPPQAAVFTNIQAPLDIDYDETKLGSKSGETSAYNVLGLVAWGDVSPRTAACRSGITTINHVDYRHLNVLFIFQQTKVLVYGD